MPKYKSISVTPEVATDFQRLTAELTIETGRKFTASEIVTQGNALTREFLTSEALKELKVIAFAMNVETGETVSLSDAMLKAVRAYREQNGYASLLGSDTNSPEEA